MRTTLGPILNAGKKRPEFAFISPRMVDPAEVPRVEVRTPDDAVRLRDELRWRNMIFGFANAHVVYPPGCEYLRPLVQALVQP